jgi:hypothetical protein
MALNKPVVAGFIVLAMLCAFAGERHGTPNASGQPTLIARQTDGK